MSFNVSWRSSIKLGRSNINFVLFDEQYEKFSLCLHHGLHCKLFTAGTNYLNNIPARSWWFCIFNFAHFFAVPCLTTKCDKMLNLSPAAMKHELFDISKTWQLQTERLSLRLVAGKWKIKKTGLHKEMGLISHSQEAATKTKRIKKYLTMVFFFLSFFAPGALFIISIYHTSE